MTILNFLLIPKLTSTGLRIVKILFLTIAILAIYPKTATAETTNYLAQGSQMIEGQSGGRIDSQGCGYIADTPNYQMSLSQRIDYMRLTVQTDGGQPTLLVLGPNSGDSFCVLGDEVSGLKPEISGVWEAGDYEIYVGDRSKSRHQFILDISTDN